MYDLIYANGDSFASGRDLAEKHYWPEARLLSWEEWQKEHNEMVKRVEKWGIKNNTTMDKTLYPIERNLAYSAQLGRIARVKTINKSTSGAGMTHICMETLKDLNELKNEYKKILVLIGLTSPGRIWFPREDKPGFPNTIILGRQTGFKNKFEKQISDHWIENTDRTDLYVNMALNLLGVENFCKQSNIDIYFVGCPLMNKMHLDEIKGFKIKDFLENKTIAYLGGEYHNYNTKNVSYTGTGHLPIQDHVKLAKEIKEKLWT